MGFEVPVSGVERNGGRAGRTTAAALGVLAVVVAFAIGTGGVASTRSAPGSDTATVLAAATPALVAAAMQRPVPASLSCRDVGWATCLRIAKAAMLALPDDIPEAIDATVWRSLLCADSSKCPPSYLDGSPPLGSVIVRFADGGPRAAINVVDGRPGPIRRAPRAWVVDWMPEPG